MALVDVPSGGRCSRPPRPSRTTRASCRFVRRAQAAGIPVEVVSDGFGFFIEPALEALGVGELPVVTARTTFDGRRARSPFPTATRPASCAGPASATASSPTRRPGARSSSSATARATATPRATATSCGPSASLVRICLEAGWPFRRWTRVPRDRRVAGRDPRRLARGSVHAARPATTPVLLRPGGLGRGPRGSAAVTPWPPAG